MPTNQRSLTSVWPSGGMVSRPMGDRNYDLIQGHPIATVPAARWTRGEIIRAESPVFATSTLGLYAYDTTLPLYSEGSFKERRRARRKGRK